MQITADKDYLIKRETLDNIANAIRDKKGTIERIKAEDMASEIRDISYSNIIFSVDDSSVSSFTSNLSRPGSNTVVLQDGKMGKIFVYSTTIIGHPRYKILHYRMYADIGVVKTNEEAIQYILDNIESATLMREYDVDEDGSRYLIFKYALTLGVSSANRYKDVVTGTIIKDENGNIVETKGLLSYSALLP